MRKKIYVAEDDRDDQFLFSEAIKGLDGYKDYDIKFASNGEELISMMAFSDIPAAVFLDLNMPKMDGKECLEKIREKYTPEMLPVIILSTSNSPWNIQETYELGANKYAFKQAEFSDLITVLKQCLSIDVIEQGQPTMEEYLLRG